ncbi:MAG: carbon-nitrogen hydrolase family protein [Hyphomicrobiaceae bacterium]|nr:carbon-nitrogen hydrolase family protein [Hyphomicrobiaceae bacterium]MCC0007966.1 carbon-nitrogen hydrolase family protein [Hyphomicrobiaceae bacterium]
MRDTLRVAAAQYPIDAVPSLDAWNEKIARWVKNGAETGAELLVFPEYGAIEQAHALGPSVYQDLDATLAAIADLADARVAVHAELARRHGVHILVGSGPKRRADGRYVNAAQLVTPTGGIGEQEKLILTPFERNWNMMAGEEIRVFRTAIGNIAIAVCYDSEFPYLARAMARAGAEILLVPQCTERVSGNYRVRTGAMARALENQFAAITSPTIGDAVWSAAVDYNNGAAGVFVPAEQGVSDTGVLAEGRMNEPGWITATVDMNSLRRLRSGGEMRNFTDWLEQPGAAAAESSARVRIVDLA